MLDLAIVDKLNRAGFVVAPYNTPEEVPSVKSVSGPARHVGEADKRVRDSRGGSPCGENRKPETKPQTTRIQDPTKLLV